MISQDQIFMSGVQVGGPALSIAEVLHARFNPHNDQIPPVRIKGYSRENLATLLSEFGLRKGAEVGVADGRNSLTLCQAIPNIALLCVDPWEQYRENPRGGPQSQHENNYDLARERLKPYDVAFRRNFSMDAVKWVADGALDFVYIDGHHGFDYVMQDIIEWSKRVRSGGIVAGHDYYRFAHAGVVNAVDAYIVAHRIPEAYVTDGREPSFFWVKP